MGQGAPLVALVVVALAVVQGGLLGMVEGAEQKEVAGVDMDVVTAKGDVQFGATIICRQGFSYAGYNP
jgi:hypothetical protein